MIQGPRLFAGTANVELMEHFAAEAVLAGLIGTTRANLSTAITGERYESRVMYPLFARRAMAAGDFAAAILFRHNAADEARHAREFERALAGKQAKQAGQLAGPGTGSAGWVADQACWRASSMTPGGWAPETP